MTHFARDIHEHGFTTQRFHDHSIEVFESGSTGRGQVCRARRTAVRNLKGGEFGPHFCLNKGLMRKLVKELL